MQTRSKFHFIGLSYLRRERSRNVRSQNRRTARNLSASVDSKRPVKVAKAPLTPAVFSLNDIFTFHSNNNEAAGGINVLQPFTLFICVCVCLRRLKTIERDTGRSHTLDSTAPLILSDDTPLSPRAFSSPRQHTDTRTHAALARCHGNPRALGMNEGERRMRSLVSCFTAAVQESSTSPCSQTS